MPRLTALFAAVLATPSLAFAHPGHGSTAPDSLTHLIEPLHAGILVAVVVTLVGLACLGDRQRE